MEKLDLGPDTLAADNPGLVGTGNLDDEILLNWTEWNESKMPYWLQVYARLTGFGQTGPYRDMAGTKGLSQSFGMDPYLIMSADSDLDPGRTQSPPKVAKS